AASRTDAGVHAQGQVVKITIPLDIKSEKLQLGMNSLLPDDIRILDCTACSATFNPNRDSTSKEYHYYFCTDKVFNPMFNDVVTHIPLSKTIENNMKLDISLMKKASKLFIGEHDFYSFAKRDMEMQSTFRTILNCEIIEVANGVFGNNTYYLKIVGKGFLTHMVRYITGALFALGRDKLNMADVKDAIINHKEIKLTAKAQSNGLHLMNICYNT
ncbi:MAG: hypothetical protein WA945_01105, partial [Arcobacteraceae bacterium]